MEQATEPSQTQPVPEEPVKSIEEDGKADEGPVQGGVTDEQWRLMMDVVLAIYEFREEDGHDPSRLFQRSVNKRNVPDYYEIIKEPMALSILKQKINKREYKNFAEFVRDCALIPHNAQTYNRPNSQAYEDALVIKDVFIAEFDKLVKQGVITSEQAELPDLGEIPEADPLPEEEEEEDEEDDDDEDDDDSDDDGRRKKKRGPRPGWKRDAAKEDGHKSADPEIRKKRGRPPRVDTPMEARIKAVLKGIRKLKGPSGMLKVRHFERLPDKAMYPDYYVEIKDPIAIDIIKRKSKRKKYHSVDHFMRDMDLMFNNAKAYNQPDSQIYKDAVDLQGEARRLAEIEKRKPDTEYLMEDGRLPLPDGILYKGELWKVGDWVHIQNPNDVTKPIVAQIYRTWQDSEGEKWVNACWYYRPEQTVHHFEKHFYPNEVVKTGQYRDHRIEEVVDRCFVMFFTRYNRGRPRGLSPDKEVYVCEARYNEEKHKLNKIKTWASCLPDEVREKDYEMDLFDVPRRIKKIPSPIKHLLKSVAKETDDLPKPTWGADNAPPIVGAVHRRPRDENESPPPEPTPSPPPSLPQPVLPTVPPRQQSISQPPTRPSVDSPGAIPLPGAGVGPARSPAAPIPPLQNSPAPVAPITYQQPQVPPAQVYQPALQRRPSTYVPQTPHATAYQPSAVAHPYAAVQPSPYTPYQAGRGHVPQAAMYNPNAPRPIEVFHLSDAANAAIPEDIRDQFHCNNSGHVLFFSTPPLDIVPSLPQKLGHSLKYLAAKEERRRLVEQRKRKEIAEKTQQEERVKRQRADAETNLAVRVGTLTVKAIETMASQVMIGTDKIYDLLYLDQAEKAKHADAEAQAQRIAADHLLHERTAQIQAHSDQATTVSLKGHAMYMDDIDPRI
ncbi:putative RSC complex subunit (RSC1) [Aspergillus clavatus NRRL 1]|uniref:RSC complex subunit (RSC1), putative n=1 Tax=Aspergillus clavatus (strain ATCC 1007 / CBS 513.65 / DSM 816 / NCTC 3887 / NRRL 1 / QM 1276 / 107) TaxID=344612 RepID=A1CJ30_ASPCL|nr:RSC complex subunit (RSC1), putative [Aspergillus clavatus NRRL 1]EAW09154.1 RSC complex subunit (RSC1), putative [Aspergillus clavatus NRRL 1]